MVSVRGEARRLSPGPRDGAAGSERELLDRLVSTGYLVALAGVALQSVAHIANGVFFDDEIQAFNADDDRSVFAWASAAATFAAAFVLFVLWLARRGSGSLLVVSAVLAFFSLDDVVRIHERVGTGIRTEVFGLPAEWGRLIWPAVFFPLLAVAFLVVWRLAARAPARVGFAVRLGLALLAAAVAAEVLTAPLYISDEASGWPGRIEVVLEEGAELAGWIFVATGITAVLATALAAAGEDRSREG